MEAAIIFIVKNLAIAANHLVVGILWWLGSLLSLRLETHVRLADLLQKKNCDHDS